jgi:hypothetical protein
MTAWCRNGLENSLLTQSAEKVIRVRGSKQNQTWRRANGIANRLDIEATGMYY